MEYKGRKLRHELKYFINYQEYEYLRNRLKEVLQIDKNSMNNNGYNIRSLYFDDMYNSAYIEKELGLAIRKKYRIRIYDLDDRIIKLERKEKFNKYISKESVSITKDEFYKIINGDFEFCLKKNNKLLRDFYIESREKILKPRIIVDYDREAYTFSYGNIRITFDKELRTAVNSYDIFKKDVATKRIFQEPIMIMEVKYDDYIPEHIKNLLQISSHTLSSASKYVLCTKVIKNLKY